MQLRSHGQAGDAPGRTVLRPRGAGADGGPAAMAAKALLAAPWLRCPTVLFIAAVSWPARQDGAAHGPPLRAPALAYSGVAGLSVRQAGQAGQARRPLADVATRQRAGRHPSEAAGAGAG